MSWVNSSWIFFIEFFLCTCFSSG